MQRIGGVIGMTLVVLFVVLGAFAILATVERTPVVTTTSSAPTFDAAAAAAQAASDAKQACADAVNSAQNAVAMSKGQSDSTQALAASDLADAIARCAALP
jgi:hypothetical protein